MRMNPLRSLTIGCLCLSFTSMPVHAAVPAGQMTDRSFSSAANPTAPYLSPADTTQPLSTEEPEESAQNEDKRMESQMDGYSASTAEPASPQPELPPMESNSSDEEPSEDDDPNLLEGWFEQEGERYHYTQPGIKDLGWQMIDGCWYYFSCSNGAMATGWQRIDHHLYVLAPSGIMQTGWIQDDQLNWYYMDPTQGWACSGWLKDGNFWYYLDPSSCMMQTGWIQDGNSWYFLTHDGSMKTGWLYHQDDWYYLRHDGMMATGWLTLADQTYYLSEDGRMVTGQKIIDGDSYFFAPDGTLQNRLEDLKAAIESYIADNRTGQENWSVSIRELNTHEMVTIHSHPQQAASVIKLFVAACVLEHYDELCAQYGSHLIDLNLSAMITMSSNESWSYLVSCLGKNN